MEPSLKSLKRTVEKEPTVSGLILVTNCLRSQSIDKAVQSSPLLNIKVQNYLKDATEMMRSRTSLDQIRESGK